VKLQHGVVAVSLVVGALTLAPAAGAGTTDKAQATIKIGNYAPIGDNETGTAYPQNPAAVRAAVRAINKDGGFNGAKGEVVVCDTKENPNDAAACGRKFVDEGVAAVVGGFTLQGSALLPILQDAGVPNIGAAATNAEDSLSPISFPLDGTLLTFPAQALQLGDSGPKSLYVARADIPDAAVVPNFIKAAANTAGVEVTGVGSTPLGAPDLVPAASAAQASGAKAVSLIYPDTDAVKFILAADQIGYHPRFAYSEGGLNPEQMKQLGDLTKNMIVPGPFPPLTAIKQFPELKQYLKDMRAEFKRGDDAAAPKYYGTNTIRPWLAVQALRDVIETDSGTTQPTAASVLAALNSAQNIDLGLIPPWTPSNSPIPIFPRVSNPYIYEMTIRKGKSVLVDKEPINIAEEVDFVAALRG
jgi:branched-chain amino acid transport system substrate-binding protein